MNFYKVSAFPAILLVLFQLVSNIAVVEGFSLNPWAETPADNFKFIKMSNPNFTLPYRTCTKDTYGMMENVVVEPCEGNKNLCYLVKGTNVSLILTFQPTFPARKVVGSLAGVVSKYLPPVKFGKPEDLCESGQLKCPLTPYETYTYKTTVFVRPQFPRLELDTRVLIHGDDHEIACALIPVKIVDPQSKLPRPPSGNQFQPLRTLHNHRQWMVKWETENLLLNISHIDTSGKQLILLWSTFMRIVNHFLLLTYLILLTLYFFITSNEYLGTPVNSIWFLFYFFVRTYFLLRKNIQYIWLFVLTHSLSWPFKVNKM